MRLTVLASLWCMCGGFNGFGVPRGRKFSTRVPMGNEDVEALLEAAAKLRAESEEAERAMGKEPTSSSSSTTTTQPASLTYSEAISTLSSLDLTSPTSLSALPSYNNPPTSLNPFPTNLKTLESLPLRLTILQQS